MTDPAVPEHLRKFLPEQPSEPTPEGKFRAWLAEQPGDDRWRVRAGSAPDGPRARVGIWFAVVVALVPFAVVLWRAVK